MSSTLFEELVPHDSRYYITANPVNYDNKIMYDIPYNPVIPQDESDSTISITHEYQDRLDKLSNNEYGLSKYWWVLAITNNVSNPFDVELGSMIRIPEISQLISDEVI